MFGNAHIRSHSTIRSLRAIVISTLVALTMLTACYTPAELPVKTTPPASTVYVSFEISSDLLETTQTLQEKLYLNEVEASLGRAQSQSMKQVATSMTTQMKGDLIRNRVAFPVVNPEKAVDLRLTGTFRADPYGLALDWQMIETSSGAVVAANTITNAFFTGNVEPFADEILAELLEIDVDRYASATGSKPTAPAAVRDTTIAAAPRSATDGHSNWAVIIGIEKYRDDLPAATWAENDARAFEDFAQTTLGIPATHIKTLIGERAGRADMASAFEEWLPRNAVDKNAVVYVFFSGHGAPDPTTGTAYLVPYDGDAAYLKTRGYALADLYSALGKLRNAQTIVFLDSCFSGSGERSVLAQGTRPLVPIREPATPRGIMALSAASASQTTGAAEAGGHGLFTYHLLAALGGGADRDRNSDITLAEVADYVSERVAEDARLQNREQTPTLKSPKGLNPKSVVLIEKLENPQY